jgi:hypothetical protein
METLRVEYFYDDEAHNWHFWVPAFGIVGGGTASRSDAERQCADAVAFVLSGDDVDADGDPVVFDAVDTTAAVRSAELA